MAAGRKGCTGCLLGFGFELRLGLGFGLRAGLSQRVWSGLGLEMVSGLLEFGFNLNWLDSN